MKAYTHVLTHTHTQRIDISNFITHAQKCEILFDLVFCP